tara:strand:- start:86 stop:463 length:378 start_codon:yes stop_codon:yes gene_type:complete
MGKIFFTKDHEWIEVDGQLGTIGITDFAQDQLGDIVYVELPEVGRKVQAAEETAVVESVKAASEIYAPVAGKISNINSKLNDDPGQVNSDPMGDGWFFKLDIADLSELDQLLDEKSYRLLISEDQ